jgi:hypothetical protein
MCNNYVGHVGSIIRWTMECAPHTEEQFTTKKCQRALWDHRHFWHLLTLDSLVLQARPHDHGSYEVLESWNIQTLASNSTRNTKACLLLPLLLFYERLTHNLKVVMRAKFYKKGNKDSSDCSTKEDYTSTIYINSLRHAGDSQTIDPFALLAGVLLWMPWSSIPNVITMLGSSAKRHYIGN